MLWCRHDHDRMSIFLWPLFSPRRSGGHVIDANMSWPAVVGWGVCNSFFGQSFCMTHVCVLCAGCLFLVGFGLFTPGAFSKSFCGEFDPGSGRTLAACLTHASRTERPQACLGYSSGERVSNTWVICPALRDKPGKLGLIPDRTPL